MNSTDEEATAVATGESNKEIGGIVERKESFLTVNRQFHNQLASLELLNPTYDSTRRKSSIQVAILNLVATVCGGGVLSLPLTFKTAGVVPALLLMLLSAVMTDFSLYILCACARRTGGKSYGNVAKAAFGSLAQVVTTVILFVLLVGILVAYMVLVKNIWTPVLLTFQKLVTSVSTTVKDSAMDSKRLDEAEDLMLAGLIVLVSPFLLKRDLYALRHTCYVGLTSLILLTLGLSIRAYQCNTTVGVFAQVKWWTNDMHDVIFAFPIVALSFLSCYNVLSVHGSLVRPTKRRVRLVLDGSVGICLFLFTMVGLCGYLCSYEDTKDNVFLNFDMSDHLLLLGRIGYGFTLLFGMPLVALPCREALLSIPDQIRDWQDESALLVKYSNEIHNEKTSQSFIVNGVDFGQEKLPLKASVNRETYGTQSPESQTVTTAETLTSHDTLEAATVAEYLVHILSTSAIVGGSYVAAVAVPGVATVWSICGSSMAIIISYVVPAACYIKIQRHRGTNPMLVSAWILLIFSVAAAMLCTAQTVSDIFSV